MKYHNWRELARECQESGKSIHGWCKDKHIPNSTCRQWLKKLKKEKLQVSQAAHSQDSNWGKIEPNKLDQRDEPVESGQDNQIRLTYKGWTIEWSPGVDLVHLKKIMKMVEAIC